MAYHLGVKRAALFLGALILLAISACLLFVTFRNSCRASNERTPNVWVRSIAQAECTFRINDSDQNGVHDYWTADVAGLCFLAPQSKQIKLIDYSIAAADIAPAQEYDALREFKSPINQQAARGGYWFAALRTSWERTTSFAACGMPESHGVSGTYVYIISEGNVLYKRDFGRDVLKPGSQLPTINGPFDGAWPSPTDLIENWDVHND